MIINFDDTQIDLVVDDDSYRYKAVKGEHSLTLHYSLPEHVEIPVGAYCEFEGETYTLESPENFKKHNTRNFEYTLVMESVQSKLKKYKFKEITTRRLKFSLTAKPVEHLQMLVDNLNQRETGWSVGKCIVAVEKVISYNHTFCSDALSQMADAFDTEWEIDGKTIHLCKVEYNKDNPLSLSYGRGNGFKSGIGRSSDDSRPVEILFTQGGERNIDASKYGSGELLLPKEQVIGYDGEYFSGQGGFDTDKARWYAVDEDGFSIRRTDKPLVSQAEDSLDCSHIYPSRVGDVSSVIVVDEEKHFYDFIDESIPENLDFSEYRIGGERITVIFQSGMLTGKEFEIEQTEDAVTGYVHSERRFKLVPQELDGRTMPDETFKPLIGDKYAVFGMMLPEAYVCDNDTKTGASWDMFREGVKYLYENEEQKFTFTGELDGIWAKKDWLNIGGKIILGGYVLFTDGQFQPDGVLIRIIGVKSYVNNPYSPMIELSNSVVGSSIMSDLQKIESNEVVADDSRKAAELFTKRSYRDAIETLTIMQEAALAGFETNFTDAIAPITIQSMMALFGDASLQFRFVNSMTSPLPVVYRVIFSNDTKILTAPAVIIQHETLGIDDVAPSHSVDEYKFWQLPAFNSPPLEDAKKYYLYAKVRRNNTSGVFYLSETAISMGGDPDYYYLWVGFLNSAFGGTRTDFALLNGFTEILPGQITTSRMRDALGRLIIDLANAKIIAQNGAEIVGKITFSSGSSGLENVEEWQQFTEVQNYVDNVLQDTLDRLQNQIDDNIESHFYHYDPTLSNIPASEWTTALDREKHLDDTFTNLDSGQSWRFTRGGDCTVTSYSGDAWELQEDGSRRSPQITDNGTTRARINFSTQKSNVVFTVHVRVSSEKDYDYVYVGNLDGASGYAARLSDVSSQDVTIAVPLAGSHYVEVWYAKDSSVTGNEDCAWFTVSDAYGWTLMADSAATRALVLAGQAQDTADGKRRVFYNTPPARPNPPYDIGDLWVQGASGDIMRCQTPQGSGLGNPSDWVKASKYTDDSAALAAINTAVSNLNNYLDGAFSDGIISKAEAESIELYLNILATEKANVDSGYSTLYGNSSLTGTAKSNLSSAKSTLDSRYSSLVSAINSVISDGKVTASEKASVDSYYTLYKNALSAYSTRYEEAHAFIVAAVNDNISTGTTAAKEDMAKRLGYSSYSDMVAAAVAGKTIINGGLIRTALIEAEAIVTSELVTKRLTAAMIAALDIVTSKLIVTDGAKIGNFTIEGGWLKSTAAADQDVGYIDMRNGDNRIAFGNDLIPSVAGGGATLTGMIRNRKMASVGGTTCALELEATGSRDNGVKAIALNARGGAIIKGSTSFIEEAEFNANISNSSGSSADSIVYYRCFVYQAPSSGYYADIFLPSGTAITNKFGYFQTGRAVDSGAFITIKILITRFSSGYYRIKSPASSTPLVNEIGNTIDYIEISKGAFVELTYFNYAWYLTSKNWS